MSVSLQQLDDRKRRALEEPLEVVAAYATVIGSSGETYLVSMSTKKCLCTCPDYLHHSGATYGDQAFMCKHIYFALNNPIGHPICPYGLSCNRTNLFHRQEFRHPSPSIVPNATKQMATSN
jgi:hypothetical protein